MKKYIILLALPFLLLSGCGVDSGNLVGQNLILQTKAGDRLYQVDKLVYEEFKLLMKEEAGQMALTKLIRTEEGNIYFAVPLAETYQNEQCHLKPHINGDKELAYCLISTDTTSTTCVSQMYLTYQKDQLLVIQQNNSPNNCPNETELLSRISIR
jgi:hypothetical protein